MEKAIIIALLITLVALFFSRVHFHFSYNLTISRDPKVNSTRKGPTGSGRPRPVEISGEVPPAVRSIRQSGDVSGVLEAARRSAEADLASALVNLGVGRQKAAEVAKRAMGQAGDFDTRMRWAIQHAA